MTVRLAYRTFPPVLPFDSYPLLLVVAWAGLGAPPFAGGIDVQAGADGAGGGDSRDSLGASE